MTRPISPNGSVGAAEVRTATFRLIRRGGYDPQQVDPFLEIVAQTLEGGPHADPRIDGNYVHGVRFTTVRRGGYLPAQVDAFLDRVIDTFDEHNQREAEAASPGIDLETDPSPTDDLPADPGPIDPLPGDDTPVEQPVADEGDPDAEPDSAPPTSTHQPASAVDSDTSHEADFERLRVLHRSGILSDKEFAVLGARVRRRSDQEAIANVGAE